jgi:hypothetical protein
VATSFPAEDVRTIITGLTGLNAERVQWDGEEIPFLGVDEDGNSGRLVLQIIATRTVGVDDAVREYPDADTTKITYSGLRIRTVQITAENFEDEEGTDTLEELRLKLVDEDTDALFEACGLSLASSEDVRAIDATGGNRVLPWATLDLTFNQTVTRVVEKDTSTGDTYINEVEMAGDPELTVAGTFTAKGEDP